LSVFIKYGMILKCQKMTVDNLYKGYRGDKMKEKFIELLIANGIEAEMGMTPGGEIYIMHINNAAEGKPADYWYGETESEINSPLHNLVKWNVPDMIFGCFDSDDYESAKYFVGNLAEQQENVDEEGIHIKNEAFTLTFEEMIAKIK